MPTKLPTQEDVRALYDYEPDTGALIHRAGDARHIGTRAGTIDKGRRYVLIRKVKFRSSRIIWLYVHGSYPCLDVDHKDRDRLNDRLNNLRLATRLQNCANKGKQVTNKSGFKGVHFSSKNNKWVAQIAFNYKKMHLGYFTSAHEAHEAYVAATTKLNGEFAAY